MSGKRLVAVLVVGLSSLVTRTAEAPNTNPPPWWVYLLWMAGCGYAAIRHLRRRSAKLGGRIFDFAWNAPLFGLDFQHVLDIALYSIVCGAVHLFAIWRTHGWLSYNAVVVLTGGVGLLTGAFVARAITRNTSRVTTLERPR